MPEDQNLLLLGRELPSGTMNSFVASDLRVQPFKLREKVAISTETLNTVSHSEPSTARQASTSLFARPSDAWSSWTPARSPKRHAQQRLIHVNVNVNVAPLVA